jgi:hypothetical protein
VVRITALIAELERVRAEHGDIEVKIPIPETEQYYGGDFEIKDLWVYDSSQWSGRQESYVRLDHL